MKNAVSGMLRHVALLRTDVSEEHIASIIRATEEITFPRIVLRFIVTVNVVPSLPSPVTLMMEVIRSS
jgi:hypothetical protein